jgi:hypothetical protein
MTQNKLQNEASPAMIEPGEEHFIGVIPDVFRWTVWGGKDRYNVAVTDKRLVFDFITDKTIPWDDYPKKRTEEILAFNKKNFAIEVGQIKSFQFMSGENVNHSCGRFDEIKNQMNVQTVKTKYSFYIANRFGSAAKETLKKAGIAFEETRPERMVGI